MDFARASEQENNLLDLQDFARRNAEQEKKRIIHKIYEISLACEQEKSNLQDLRNFCLPFFCQYFQVLYLCFLEKKAMTVVTV